MQTFKFELGDTVELSHSKESGSIIGRAEFSHQENNYLLRYKGGDGRQLEAWWGESSLQGSEAGQNAASA